MRKEKLILLPLSIGLTFLFVSWYQSYPLSVDSPFDFPFNHISLLYWLGLAMLLGTFYVIAGWSRNNTLKWIAVCGIVTSMYSLSYFYYLLPGSDSHYVRGQAEYFLTTGDLDPSGPGHSYFQWPFLYLLCNVATNLMGLQLIYFEFILYAVIGFLCTTSLYAYFSRIYSEGSHLAVIAFFIISTNMFNYQFAPFSLAISLLFLLFMIESQGATTRNTTLAISIIFVSMTFFHPFVPVFFSLYTLVRFIISKEKRYLNLFLLTLVIYLVVLLFFTAYFPTAVRHLVTRGTKYSAFVERLTVEPVSTLDATAQMFASAVLIVTALISGLGFMIVLLRRKFRHTDLAILITGILYITTGAFLPILGLRAFAIIVISVSFGATYFLRSKFRKHYKCLILVVIILFTFVPLHKSYSWKWFQTRDDYRSANFLVEFYNFSKLESILSYVTVGSYIQPKMSSYAVFDDSYRRPPQDLENYDIIIYTVGLERSLLMWNYSVESEIHTIEENFNIVFSSGSSFIATHMNTSRYR